MTHPTDPNWYLIEPVMPSEIPGSGFHEPDIGPIHRYPMTRKEYEFRREFSKHVREATDIFRESVVPALKKQSPLAAAFRESEDGDERSFSWAGYRP